MRCFIIGNGPSQNNFDLTLLKDETTFGSNGIHLIFDKFMPSYWFVTDNYYFNCHKDKIINSNYTGILYSTANIYFPETITPFTTRKVDIIDCGINTPTITHGFETELHSAGDHSIGCVTYLMLQKAWQLDFREFYMIGMDSKIPRPPLEDHMVEGYGGDMDDPNERGLQELHPDVWKDGFRFAREFIEENDGVIYDVSDGECGFFEHKKFEDIL